jgi:bifunctional enzyme CysN/CysC
MQGGRLATEARKRVVTITVSGAAGVGKSTLIKHFAKHAAASSRVLTTETAEGSVFAGAEPPDISVLVIDARQGFSFEARKYTASARTAGIRHIVLAFNNFDPTAWSQAAFEAADTAFRDFAGKFEFATAIAIPISTRSGDNVAASSADTAWYAGPTLLAHLGALDVDPGLSQQPLRLLIDTVSPADLYTGTITSGTLRRGDTVLVAASGAAGVVEHIVVDDVRREAAVAGERVTISLADIDVGTGDVIARAQELPQFTEQFSAHMTCLSDQSLLPGREYKLTLGGQELTASVTAIKYRLNIDSLRREPARTLGRNEIGVCTIATLTPLAVDDFSEFPHTGRFVLSDLYSDAMIAAGTVDFALRRGMNIYWQPLTVTKDVRASLKAQRACVVWFTGLSGSGKSTIANLVEGWLALHECHTYLLDGDNVRHGLNKDLGFTAADRVENIRRVGEVARLFVDAGVIVLCSFISPFRAEREAVRSLVDENEFIEIHVTAPLDVCERRDPKGLYAKSRAGQLPNFTGIDSPYEMPEAPDLVLDTTSASAAQLAERVVALLQARGVVGAPAEPARVVRGL